MYQQATDQSVITLPQRDHSYLHTVQAGALLPLIQSGIIAIALGVLTFILAYSARSRDPLVWAGVVTLIVFIAAYLFLQRHWLTLTAERMTGLDLNRDGQIGKPVPAPIARIEVMTRDSRGNLKQGSFYNLPASEAQLRSLAAGITAGVTFAESYWTGRGSPFSLRQFRALRAEMIRRGLLVQTNPSSANQGFSLTPEGETIFQHYAPPSPTA